MTGLLSQGSSQLLLSEIKDLQYQAWIKDLQYQAWEIDGSRISSRFHYGNAGYLTVPMDEDNDSAIFIGALVALTFVHNHHRLL